MNNIKKFLKVFKEHKLLSILSIILSLVYVTTNLLIPFFFGKTIDLVDDINNEQQINNYILIILVLVAGAIISQFIISLLNNKISFSCAKKLRDDCFKKLDKLPISFFDNNDSGKIINNVIIDVNNYGNGILLLLNNFIPGIIQILGVIIIMLLINWIIALFVIFFSPLSLLITKFITKKCYKYFKDQSIKRGIEASKINEVITLQKGIQAYSYEDKSLENYKAMNEDIQKTSFKALFFSSIVNPSSRFINSIIYATVALVGALLIIDSNPIITIGILVSLLSYVNQYTKPINEITNVFSEIQNALACYNNIESLLNETEEIIPTDEIGSSSGNITIKDLTFSYNPNKELIENFSLDVRSGQKIAIVGKTGAGKSTIINLLMRFYEPKSGSIELDGKDIYLYSKSSLRANFGMVLQDTWIKEDTLRNNIRMNMDKSDDEILEVINKCEMNHFLGQLPNGLDSVIGNNKNLSIGERQLICIARVMLKNPDILILDEATSNIDTETEVKVQKAFDLLMKDKTSFVVAHRLKTIKNADKIIVMDEGKIVEVGTHQELLAKEGYYYIIYNSQYK